MKPWAWILLFAVVGFGLSAGFSTELGLPRDILVLAYLVAGGGLLLSRALEERLTIHLRSFGI